MFSTIKSVLQLINSFDWIPPEKEQLHSPVSLFKKTHKLGFKKENEVSVIETSYWTPEGFDSSYELILF